MRIGIDIRLFKESGNGRYIRNILREISKIDSQNAYVLFGLAADFNDVKELLKGSRFQYEFVATDILWYTFKEQIVLPYLLYKYNLDLVHFPHFNVPIFYLKSFVVTVHDLTHFNFSMQQASTLSPLFYFIKKQAYALTFRYAVSMSRRIITISDFVKKELISKFSVDDKKVSVIYEAAEEPKVIDDAGKESALHTFVITKPFFFYVGNAHPHKNIEFLIESFVSFNTEGRYQLVLSGKETYFWKRIKSWAQAKGYVSDIVYTGLISEAELAAFYSQAVAYVFPSLSEGFGLPVLEAMSYGCPVICSNTASLPEVGGDAAYYINPTDAESLVSAFDRISTDSALRSTLIEKGFHQYTLFSWERAGAQTLNIYNSQ